MTAPPPAFHIMIKPTGSICNLDCAYCFYLSKENLYPGSNFRLNDDLLKHFVEAYIAAQHVPEVTFAWQGGEPTLMGVEFFKRAVDYQKQAISPGMQVANSLQTNGVLLNDEWGEFLKEHNFLVGISIDGPSHLHDTYRVDKGGRPTSKSVIAGLDILKKHGVDFNILCAVHAANQDHPLEVYHFFRDELGAQFIQFIPIVERTGDNTVTSHSVTAKGYGQFLKTIFDEWVRHDVGRVFIQLFDVALGQWAAGRSSLCVFAETCGTGLALEHNGDLYSCDHFVEPDYFLGNIKEKSLVELVGSERQTEFGQAKKNMLPVYCQECQVRFACNGGCPKNRFIQTPDGENSLNYLCEGYRAFFNHIHPAMAFMTNELHHKRPPANVMLHIRQQDEALARIFARTNRNDPCPCGSGRKFKYCHGKPK